MSCSTEKKDSIEDDQFTQSSERVMTEDNEPKEGLPAPSERKGYLSVKVRSKDLQTVREDPVKEAKQTMMTSNLRQNEPPQQVPSQDTVDATVRED
jgi:hypothetical protein